MFHNPPHTHDELNKSFCNMKRNSTLKMWINCAPLPLVCVLVSIQIKSRPVWRSDNSTKSMQKICYRNYRTRWLQSKQFRFSQFLLIDLFSVQGLQCKSLSQAMILSNFILICVKHHLLSTWNRSFCGNLNHWKLSSFVHTLLNRLT
jgi:hypothetical protein